MTLGWGRSCELVRLGFFCCMSMCKWIITVEAEVEKKEGDDFDECDD